MTPANTRIAPAFTWWVLIGMSDGKVDHDHLALVIALWVLPTVGGARRGRASYGDQTRSEAAGWAIRCVQICVIATYFLSSIAKLRSAGWALTWPGSAVLTWVPLMSEIPSLARSVRGARPARWSASAPG